MEAWEAVDEAFSDQLSGLPLPDLIPTQAPWLTHDVVALPFRQTWGFGFQLMLEEHPAGTAARYAAGWTSSAAIARSRAGSRSLALGWS